MNNPIDKNKLIQEMLKNKGGDRKKADEIINSLSPEDAEKVRRTLNDKELTKKLLSSKQAQELMKQLFKGGNNNG